MVHASLLLKKWRGEQQLTQADAARRLGLSQAALSDYEAAKKSPDVRRALEIARITEDFVPVTSWGAKRSAKRTGTDG